MIAGGTFGPAPEPVDKEQEAQRAELEEQVRAIVRPELAAIHEELVRVRKILLGVVAQELVGVRQTLGESFQSVVRAERGVTPYRETSAVPEKTVRRAKRPFWTVLLRVAVWLCGTCLAGVALAVFRAEEHAFAAVVLLTVFGWMWPLLIDPWLWRQLPALWSWVRKVRGGSWYKLRWTSAFTEELWVRTDVSGAELETMPRRVAKELLPGVYMVSERRNCAPQVVAEEHWY